MDTAEIDEVIKITPPEVRELWVRNYFKSKNPEPGLYYISVQGTKIVERLIEINDPSVARAKAANSH